MKQLVLTVDTGVRRAPAMLLNDEPFGPIQMAPHPVIIHADQEQPATLKMPDDEEFEVVGDYRGLMISRRI